MSGGGRPTVAGDRVHTAYLLQVDPDQVADWYSRGGLTLKGDPLEQLGRALASSPPLNHSGAWALAVRPADSGMIGAVGSFGDACVPRLEALRWQVFESLERLLYLDPPSVREAARALAERLRHALGPAVLADARFTAIPRGGMFVLGELAYLLGLQPEQLSGGDGADRPRVVVDDCAISGLRFRQTLDRADRSNVVFAHLCSHPDLRAAVESDPRVDHCVAGRDLHDHGPVAMGDAYPAWRTRWEARQPGQHFWLGKPDHVCLPWSEPDVRIWNPVLEMEDPGWRVVPPEYCLKNQVRFERGGIDLQVHRSPGPLRPGPGVLDAHLGDDVVVARLEASAAVGLAGVGGDMWKALMAVGSIRSAAKALTDVYDVSTGRMEADLIELSRSLERAGLIEGLGADE